MNFACVNVVKYKVYFRTIPKGREINYFSRKFRHEKTDGNSQPRRAQIGP